MSFSDAFSSSGRDLRLWGKLRSLNWGVVALVTAISCIGFGLLYSVAGGSFEPWAERQMVRFAIGMALLIGVALINLRTWFQLAYPIYGVSLLLLVAVEFVGRMGKGAERWIDIGPLQLQPSELMKIALILALSRFLHGVLLDDVSRPTRLLPALLSPVVAMLPKVKVTSSPLLAPPVIVGAGSVPP